MTGRARVRELDGLRGVAILAVVVAHLWTGVPPDRRPIVAGTHSFTGLAFFGVTLFFVLSGFLITRLLLAERAATGTVALRAFYGRRARRLLPALVVLVVAYTVVALLSGERWTLVAGTNLRALTYTQNLGGLVPVPSTTWLEHTWSLAIEEQFYLVWPATLLYLARRTRDRDELVAVTLALAATFAAIRAAMMGAGGPGYGTIHVDAMLIGAALAIRPWQPPRWAVAAAVLLVVGNTAYTLSLDGYSPMGSTQFLVHTTAAAVLVAAAPQLRGLACRPLVYFGTISYGLYLFHGPILRLGYPPIPSMAVAVLAAHLSWRFVEQRFLVPRTDGVGIGALAAPGPAGTAADGRLGAEPA